MDAAIKMKRGRGQNYMMRSEKRPGYPNTPPQKPKKSIGYQVLTVILLIVFCPVGLILLWRKRLCWPGWVKFVAMLLSLALFFMELGAALWYPFEDERIRSVQQKASVAIEQAVDTTTEWISGVSEKAGSNWSAFWNNKREIGAAAGNYALGLLQDAIATPSPTPTQVPPMMLTQSQNNPPTATPTAVPTATPSPTPTAAPTATPAMENSANVLQRPTPSSPAAPSLDPKASATPVPPVTPTPSPTATPLITPTPVPTLEPTMDPARIPQIQDTADAPVWYTGNGKYYHKASVCGSMSNAKQHPLSSAVAAGKKACPYCNPIEEKWAKEKKPIIYVSADRHWHIRTDCESNTAEWTFRLLDEARSDRSIAPCDACGSRYYVNGIIQTQTNVPQATQPAQSVQPQTTQAAAPELMKAGELLVWHTSNGKWYHKASKCGSMSNASQHTLASAAAGNRTACPYCNPIGEEWAKVEEGVVFVSAKKVWHADEECSANTGDWELMTISKARADKALTACTACGANLLASGASASKPTVTAAPGATAAPEAIEDGLNLNQVINGDVLVYYSGNTSHYHRRNRCASSATTVFQPHTLMEALIEGKIACPVCSPDAPEIK